MPSERSIAAGERLESRHALAGFDLAVVFTTSNQVPAGGTILASPIEPTEIGQAQSFLEAVPGVARISVPASKGGVDYELDVLDVPGGTSLYKALKIPATGLFPQDDILNRFAVSTNWYSSLDVASAYADSDWGRSQGYEVVEFAAPKALRLIDLGDDDTLGYVWASLEADVAWTESQLALLQGADPPTTNPESVATVAQKLVGLRRGMEIVQLTTGYNASYARQLELLVTYGDAITNDFTYDPDTEIVRRGISPTDTFIVETATSSVWRPSTLVTGSGADPVDVVTWGGTVDDLNRISFTTDIDKELTSILGTYLNVDGYFAAELPSLFHRDGRLIEEVGLFIPRDSTDIVSRPTPPDINVSLPEGMTASDSLSRSGSSRLIKQGLGTLILDRANTHTGGTIVEAGELVLRNPAALGTGPLRILSGARVTIQVGTGQVVVAGLDLTTTSTLDVGRGSILITDGGIFDNTGIIPLIARKLGHLPWAGPGIMSSSIQPDSFREIGYQLLPDGSLKVGYSAVGDANMDGTVSVQDLIALNAGGKYGTAATDAGWWQGDFNYDGRVNVTDLIALLSSGLYGAGSYMPMSSSSGAAISQSFEAAELAAVPPSVTLTSYSAPESQPEPVLAATSTSRATEPRRIDEFNWAAIANQSETEKPTDGKVTRWRMVGR